MRTRLFEILESENRGEQESQIELDEASLRRLEALGYLARRPTTAELSFDEDKEDPKDLIQFYETDQRLTELVRQEEYDEARPFVNGCCARGRTMSSGTFKWRESPWHRTTRAWPRMLTFEPSSWIRRTGTPISGWPERSRCSESRTRPVLHFRRAIAIKPDFIEAKASLAEVLADQGHLDEAATLLGEVATVEPERVKSIAELGMVRVKQGRLDEAIVRFREALRIEPERAERCGSG